MLMDFPSIATSQVEIPEKLTQCLGSKPREVLMGSWLYMAIFDSESEIKALNPDFSIMKELNKSVVVTAKGDKPSDFVSRCFGQDAGIPEDQVTGSSHCALVPYWAVKLSLSVQDEL